MRPHLIYAATRVAELAYEVLPEESILPTRCIVYAPIKPMPPDCIWRDGMVHCNAPMQARSAMGPVRGPRAASGFTAAGLPPPTDIQVSRLGAVKECHKRP